MNTTWEYAALQFEVDEFRPPLTKIDHKQVSKYGAEGWELVSVMPFTGSNSKSMGTAFDNHTTWVVYTFKRPVAAAPDPRFTF